MRGGSDQPIRKRVQLPVVEAQAFAPHAVQRLRELDGVDVVDAGRLGADAQGLVVAGEAEDRADAQSRRAQGVALKSDAIAVAGHHGQHRLAAFPGQDGGARQGRAVNLAAIIGHHHRVQTGRQRGRELLHGGGIRAGRRLALGRDGQPAGAQRLGELTLRHCHRWYPLPGRAPRPLRPRELRATGWGAGLAAPAPPDREWR